MKKHKSFNCNLKILGVIFVALFLGLLVALIPFAGNAFSFKAEAEFIENHDSAPKSRLYWISDYEESKAYSDYIDSEYKNLTVKWTSISNPTDLNTTTGKADAKLRIRTEPSVSADG